MKIPRSWWWLLPVLSWMAGWWMGAPSGTVDAGMPAASPAGPRPPAALAFSSKVDRPVFDAHSPAGRWALRVRQASVGEFPRLWEEGQALGPSENQTPFPRAYVDEADSLKSPENLKYETWTKAKEWFLALWMRQDWRGACAFFTGRLPREPSVSGYDLSTCGVFFALFHPQLAADLWRRPGDFMLMGQQAFRHGLLGALAASDPETFQTLELSEEETRAAWGFLQSKTLRLAAQHDPALALHTWKAWNEKPALASDWYVSESLQTAFAGWLQRGETAASIQAWLETLPTPESRRMAFPAFFRAYAEVDPRAAWQAMAALKDWSLLNEGWSPHTGAGMPMRPNAEKMVLAAIARESPHEAVRLVEQLRQEWRKQADNKSASGLSNEQSLSVAGFTQSITNAVAETLPEAPAALFQQLAAFDFQSMATESKDAASWQRDIMTAWIQPRRGAEAELLIEAAAKQAASNESLATTLQPALEVAWQQLFARDAQRAWALWQTQPPALQGPGTATLLQRVHPTSPEATRELLATVQPNSLESSFVANAAAMDPAAVAAWVGELAEDGGRHEAFDQLAATWGRSQPHAAAAWLAAQPDYAARHAAAEKLVTTWAAYEEDAASQWVAGLPSGATRDQAAAGLTRAIVTSDPEAAWAWAQSISRADLRHDLSLQAAWAWRQEDAAAAQAAMEKAGFSEEDLSATP